MTKRQRRGLVIMLLTIVILFAVSMPTLPLVPGAIVGALLGIGVILLLGDE